MFKSSKILITGGTGSFGRTMATFLLKKKVREVRIFSRDEGKQYLMRSHLSDDRLKFYVGDVRDRDSVARAMKNVDYVFHAAALKQVPSCEFFPLQAVKTNIVGSDNVIQEANYHGVKSLVCLSTDKAVAPCNAMGMSKALMEKVALSAAREAGRGETKICCVRYGNVMYSRGSVIPLFINQIKSGKSITVTEPKMTRFLMSLSDSVHLVEHAFLYGEQGDIFVRKSPACTVMDLAYAVKELFQANNPVEIIGIRHGEKMYETLVSVEELCRTEDRGEYFRASMDGRDLNYKKYYTEGDKKEVNIQEYNSENTSRLNREQVKDLLLTLPEFREEMKLAGLL